MKSFNYSCSIYSPRWGHPDGYNFIFSDDGISLTSGTPKRADMRLNESGDPEWSGHGIPSRNPLMSIMQDDGIYVSNVVPDALVFAWSKWRDGRGIDEIKPALDELFGWVDETARSKPSGDFWSEYF